MIQNNTKTLKQAIFGTLFVITALFVVSIPSQALANGYGYGNREGLECSAYNCVRPNPGYVSTPEPIYTPVPTPVYTPEPIYTPAPTPVYIPQPTYQPTYDYNYTTYPIIATCYANTTYANTGTVVTWTANASGGQNGYYTYTWSGSDGLYGSSNSATIYYSTPGTKTASVEIQSGNQYSNVECSNSVSINSSYSYLYNTAPTYAYATPVAVPLAYNNNIQIACYADATSARIGVPVTWAVEATGASGNFTYAWTGSDGLSGNQSSIIDTYVTPGLKSAVVTVTSSDGQSQAKACGNTVQVGSNNTYVRATPPPAPQVQPQAANNGQSAAALFSLGNVPWGSVAVLVILILLIMVVYLIYNKKKI